MKLELNIKMVDGQHHNLTCTIADFIAWERKSGRKTSDLAMGIGVEDLAFLAYSALTRAGEHLKPFDGWINDIDEILEDESDPKVMK